MTWEREWNPRLEIVPEMGGLHVSGWSNTRHCGCTARVGMRMDEKEPTMGITPCEDHEVYCQRVLDLMKNLPPSDEEVLAMFERLLELELGVMEGRPVA